MPEIPFDVVKIGAAAGGQYGVVEGRIKGDIAGNITLTADACHGLQLGVAGKLAGLVEGDAQALFIGAKLRGEAAAEAGAKVIVRLEPNLFDTLGLSVEAGAYARAHVAGSVAVYLTPEHFAAFVNEHLDDFTADLFLIFLEEVYAEVGVWGKAAFAAMIDAHLNVVLDVRDVGAGFEISGGYNCGLEVGTGWDYTCQAGFRDLRRAVLRSSLRISQEVQGHIHTARLPGGPFLALGFDFAFPLITLIAYDLGRASHERKALLTADETARIVLDDFVQNLQRFAIDKLVESAVGRLTGAFTDLYYSATGIELGDEEVDQLEIEIQALTAILRRGRISEHDLSEIIGRSVAIIDLIDGGLFDPLKRPLTLVWTSTMLALQIKGELDEFFADIDISNSVLGGVGTSAVASMFPAAPDFVMDEVRAVLGQDVITIGTAEAVDFLIGVGAEELLTEHVPAFAEFRDTLRTSFDLSEGDLVADLLSGWKGQGSLAGLKSYSAFKGFVKAEMIDGLLLGDLLPQLQDTVGGDALAEYVREVVEPSVHVVSDFVFSRLDSLLIDDVTSPMQPESRLRLVEGMSAGCGVVIYNVVARNVVFFDNLVTDFVLQTMHQQFGVMRTWLDDPAHPFFQSSVVLASQNLPGKPDVSQHVDALRILLLDIVTTLQQITGPSIYTYHRRKRLYHLKRDILLGIGGSTGFQDGPAIEAAIAEMIQCNIPGVQLDRIGDLAGLIYEIGVESLEVLVEYLLPSLGDFFLAVTLAQFRDLRETLLTHVHELRDALLTALADYKAASDAITEDFTAAMEAAAGLLNQLLTNIEAHLDSNWEATLKARIRIIGEEQIEAQNLGAGEQMALVSFHTVDWLLIGPAIDVTAALIRNQFDDVEQLLNGFADDALGGWAAFVAFKDSIETIALDNLAGLVVSAADCAEAVIDTLFPEYVLQQIERYLQVRAEQKQLQQDGFDAQNALALLDGARAAARDRYEAVAHRSNLDVKVISPRADFEFVYPGSVELNLHLHHFTMQMLTGQGNRLQVMVNGTPVVVETTDVEYSAKLDLYLFRKRFPAGFLADGLNILEVSWIRGESSTETRRQTVAFLVDADTYYPDGLFQIDFNYDPPGDDVPAEYVELFWNGDDSVDLTGWQVRDRAGHSYVIPALVLDAGQGVRVLTGGSPGNDLTAAAEPLKILHMGRRKAVWNNTGDTLFLLRDGVVLVDSATYLGLG